MIYSKVFTALNKAKVKYVVAGGVAVVFHGYQRFTGDLDLIVFLEEKNLENLFITMGKIGYIPKVPATKDQFRDKKQRGIWQKEKGMLVFPFVQKGPAFNIVDVFIKHPIRFDLLYKKRVVAKIGGISIPLIGIDHLIQIKKKSGRDIDLIDVAQLKAIKHAQGK